MSRQAGRAGARSSYAEILRTPGARAFVAAAFVGRLPLSMLGIGTVLLVTATTGSYGLAGFVSGTLALAGAVAGPQIGRLADRFGQRRVLIPALTVHAIGLVGLIVCADAHAPRALLFVTAAVAGGAYPSLGAFVRARWSAALGSGAALQTAFALESVIDEVVFATGPVVVTLLASALAPATGLLTALAFALAGGLAFAAQRATEPAVVEVHHRASALASPGLRVLIGAFASLGMLFGALDVAVVAVAHEHGAPAVAGLLLALFSIASGVAGIAYGAHAWQAPLARRLRVSLLLLCVGVVPLSLANTLWTLGLAITLAGVMIAPTLICGFGLVQELVPASALTEGLTWLTTALAAGIAIGLAIAGQVVEATDGSTAFLVTLAAAGGAALLVTVLRRPLSRDPG